jgi:peptidoglycan/LPS O-acetylase OafA/YrhL
MLRAGGRLPAMAPGRLTGLPDENAGERPPGPSWFVPLGLRPVYARIMPAVTSVPLAFVACALVTFAAALPLSYLTYRFVELPGIKLGKAFYGRVERRKVITPINRKP